MEFKYKEHHTYRVYLFRKIKMSDIKKLNGFAHILARSTIYIGSITTTEKECYVLNDDNKIEMKTVSFNNGLLAIARELGSNCIDNSWRSSEAKINMTSIKITIDDDHTISFWNDGSFISAKKKIFEQEDYRTGKITSEEAYPIEFLFGEAMCGSNFDDNTVRKTSGLNGVGAKTACVFSTIFTVEHSDPIEGKKVSMVFSNNGKNRTKPKITSYTAKNGWTKITFTPDYERFGYDITKSEVFENFTDLLRLYALEIAAVTGIAVTFTASQLPSKKYVINTFEKYARMYYPDVKTNKIGSIKIPNGDECALLESHINPEEDIPDELDECRHLSYVNGICTSKGGIHVNAWRDAVISTFVRTFNARPATKGKTALKTTAKKVYPYLTFFIRTELDRPVFSSQMKDKLDGRLETGKKEVIVDYRVIPTGKSKKDTEAAANIKEDIDNLVKKMMKWSFIPLLEAKLSGKTEKVVAKKPPRGNKIQDCRNAGHLPAQCTLWCSEGLSPKALVVDGVSSIDDRGMDDNGIYAIQGKFLNVRTHNTAQIDKNQEIQDIRGLLGLYSTKADYSKDEIFKKLRYHKFKIAADMDDDGIHIRGLLINFFYYLYPSLFKREGFLNSFSTAAVKVTFKGNKLVKHFYSNLEYKKWYDEYTVGPDLGPAILEAKYLKGLAAINPEDAPDYFINPKVVEFFAEGDEEDYMSLGFGGTDQDKAWRKDWIIRDIKPYSPKVTDEASVKDEMSSDSVSTKEEAEDAFVYEGRYGISTFIDKQLVIYHRMALRRALPEEFDGLKESQRKILYGVIKMPGGKTKDLEKVIGYVKSVSQYHHGGTSISGAIAGMATRYPGDNNIPLLKNDGQFATRLLGPSEFGADRYLHTALEPIAKDIFMDVDLPLLEVLVEDNEPAEYRHFIPVINMLAVNGSEGIASGYSTKMPCHNPIDVINYQLAWLDDNLDTLPPMKPWYRGITGPINMFTDKDGKNKWSTEGVLTKCIGKGCTIKMGKKGSKCHGISGWWHITDLPVGLWSDSFKEDLDDLKEDRKTKKGEKIPKCLSDYANYCTGNIVHFMIKPVKGWEPDMNTNLKMMKRVYSLNNMVTIDCNNYPTRHKTVEDMINLWMPKRLHFYNLRKEHLIKLYNHDKDIASSRYIFIKAVIDNKLNMKQTKAMVEKDIQKLGLKKMVIKEKKGAEIEDEQPVVEGGEGKKKKNKNEPSYEYLLSMKMVSQTDEKLEKLKKEVDTNQQKIDSLAKKTGSDLWRVDLENTRKSWLAFVKANPHK